MNESVLSLPLVACMLFANGPFAQNPPPTPTGGARIEPQKRVEAPQEQERVSPMNGTLVVLNKAEASASLLDLSTGNEIERIRVGDGPHEVAISPDGNTAVVCNYGGQTPGNSLTLIDIPARKATRTVDLGEYRRPHGIVYFRDGQRVIVTCEQNKAVLVVNLDSGTIEKSMNSGANVTHMVVVTSDESRAFVSNIGSHSICAFDLATGERLAEIPTGQQAEGLDIFPDGSQVWVTNRMNNTISIVDPTTLEVVANLDSPTFPIRVKITPDGTRALVSNARSGDLAVFDVKERKEVARIKMDEEPVSDAEGRLFSSPEFSGSPVPVGILILPDGSHAFVANTQADVITVINLASLKIVGRLQAGKEPDGLGYSPFVFDAP